MVCGPCDLEVHQDGREMVMTTGMKDQFFEDGSVLTKMNTDFVNSTSCNGEKFSCGFDKKEEKVCKRFCDFSYQNDLETFFIEKEKVQFS